MIPNHRKISALALSAALLGTSALSFSSAQLATHAHTPEVTAPQPANNVQPPAAVVGPHVHGVRTVSTYSFADAIRESIEITTDYDSDGDGHKDTIMIDLVRPREAAEAGTKVPVIMDPSPYFTTFGRGTEGDKKTYAADGSLKHFPLWYDNYFVERGYAVAALDVTGTARSNGCGDVGGQYDVAAVTTAINWLNGQGTARYKAGGRGIATADWSTGNVGLIGKSYDGTVANGAAATGVAGLRTIVPIGGISSWYLYNRIAGMPLKYDYMGKLGQAVTNAKRDCAPIHNRITRETNSGLGMNPAWAARDYLKNANQVKASVLIAHGQHDDNVRMVHAGQWAKALRDHDVPVRMWLTQAGHTDPFDVARREWVEYLHKWFDHWLSGLPNDVMTDRAATVEHAVGTFTTDAQWPAGAPHQVQLGNGTLGDSSTEVVTLADTRASESTLLRNPGQDQAGRQVFLTAPLASDVRLSGQAALRLRIKTPGGKLPLTARVVDYGTAERYTKTVKAGGKDCWGSSIPGDSACYPIHRAQTARTDAAVIAKGWLNAEFRNGIDQPEPMPTNQWTDVTIPIVASDNVIPAGHRLGLILTLSDNAVMRGFSAKNPIQIDLAYSSLTGNFVGAESITPAVNRAVSVRSISPLVVPTDD